MQPLMLGSEGTERFRLGHQLWRALPVCSRPVPPPQPAPTIVQTVLRQRSTAPQASNPVQGLRHHNGGRGAWCRDSPGTDVVPRPVGGKWPCWLF